MVTPQRTAETRFVIPTPIIEPVMVCVVETGIPMCSVTYKATAPAVSAATVSAMPEIYALKNSLIDSGRLFFIHHSLAIFDPVTVGYASPHLFHQPFF